MWIHALLGLITFLSGAALVLLGTDYGRIMNVTMSVIAGSVFMLWGMARIKFAWQNRKKTGNGQRS